MRTVCLVLSLVLLGGWAWGQEWEIEYLPEAPGTIESGASAINDRGQAVGWCKIGDSGYRAVIWDKHDVLTLPLPPDYTNAWAEGIDNTGTVYGTVTRQGFPPNRTYEHAFVWNRDSGLVVIFPSNDWVNHISAILPDGTAYGWAADWSGRRYSFVWTAQDGYQRIEVDYVDDCNQQGRVAGANSIPQEDYRLHAFVGTRRPGPKNRGLQSSAMERESPGQADLAH